VPFYVEFPTDPVVNVNWKKKDGDGSPDPDAWPCGAFRHGYGKYDSTTGITHYGEIPGNSIFILTDWNIYGIGFDFSSPHETYQPYSYWWSTADYNSSPINPRDVPYVWNSPSSWTLTVDLAELTARKTRERPGIIINSVTIQEFRNLNIQALKTRFDPVAPDREVKANTIDIQAQTVDEVYPPGFRVLYEYEFGGTPPAPPSTVPSIYPPMLVQAHCKLETTGDYPPRPPSVDEALGGIPYAYPAFGRNDWPIRPPPPPPYE
jgi:hypothetical protein